MYGALHQQLPSCTQSESLPKLPLSARHSPPSPPQAWIDAMDEELPKLTKFILPSGGQAAASLHHARSVGAHAAGWDCRVRAGREGEREGGRVMSQSSAARVVRREHVSEKESQSLYPMACPAFHDMNAGVPES